MSKIRVETKILCDETFRRDGNTKYIPVLKVMNPRFEIGFDGDIVLQIDSGKKVQLKGDELMKAIKNAENV